jgi:hypothetical protein
MIEKNIDDVRLEWLKQRIPDVIYEIDHAIKNEVSVGTTKPLISLEVEFSCSDELEMLMRFLDSKGYACSADYTGPVEQYIGVDDKKVWLRYMLRVSF